MGVEPTARRGFLARLAGAIAGLAANDLTRGAVPTRAQAADPDAWIAQLTGAHRCLFDFPAHAGGMPLIHMYNYLNTYREAYGAKPGEVNAVGTLYFGGPTASIPLAFNDASWARYRFGERLGLKDPAGRFVTRNVFCATRAGDPVLEAGTAAGASLDNLHRMGAMFLLCNNAFMELVAELAGSGHGAIADVEKDLRANLIPGVVTVPAMVIAIEKAQAAGIAYNRQ